MRPGAHHRSRLPTSASRHQLCVQQTTRNTPTGSNTHCSDASYRWPFVEGRVGGIANLKLEMSKHAEPESGCSKQASCRISPGPGPFYMYPCNPDSESPSACSEGSKAPSRPTNGQPQ